MESLGNLIKRKFKILLIVFNMEYYTKREYNLMKNSLERKVNSLNKKIESLNKELNTLKEDYEILLTTATEKEEVDE